MIEIRSRPVHMPAAPTRLGNVASSAALPLAPGGHDRVEMSRRQGRSVRQYLRERGADCDRAAQLESRDLVQRVPRRVIEAVGNMAKLHGGAGDLRGGEQ